MQCESWFETIKYKYLSVIKYIVADIRNFEDKKPVSSRFFMQKIPNWIAVDASRVGKSIFIRIQYLSSFSSQQTWCQFNTFYMSVNYSLIFCISRLEFSKFNDISLIQRYFANIEFNWIQKPIFIILTWFMISVSECTK